ncbi:LptF/LptG family permease [Candidatus Pelagibacter sp.]|nr:LptF/LptG family permease [Candidatus Pelagibacter sp.]
MKKLIFRKFIQDTLIFFTSSLLIMGLIVWTIQAVNFFDYVTEDGHGLKVYFFYSIFNFPKIIHRILPFIFFISLFYTILNYELKNELSIFWINGVSKISFSNKVLTFSIIVMFFQMLLGSYISPSSQYKARNFLKNSNIDFFTSLIKEGKFINVVKDLTIFIDKKNDDGSYTNIFLDDSTKINLKGGFSRMIYAKKGVIIDNGKQKIFKLLNGRVINNEQSKINIFDFDEIDFSLDEFTANTITVPKIQEIQTTMLLRCIFNLDIKKNIFDSFECGKNLNKEIKQELLKRLYKPIYIPIITIFCSFLIIYSKNKAQYNKNKNLIFILTFFLLIFSEGSLRYSISSNISLITYLMLPWTVFIFAYLLLYRAAKHV